MNLILMKKKLCFHCSLYLNSCFPTGKLMRSTLMCSPFNANRLFSSTIYEYLYLTSIFFFKLKLCP